MNQNAQQSISPDFAERCARLGALLALADERYWRKERLAGRPFGPRTETEKAPTSPVDLGADGFERQILAYLLNHVAASPHELRVALGVSRGTITRKLARLRAAGAVRATGKTRRAEYSLPGSDELKVAV